MNTILRHKIIGFTLAGIFTVFNIGLPVVVASCPMSKYTDSSACMSCNNVPSDGVARYMNAVDKSCCVTRYASDKNKVEFLKTNVQSESAKYISTADFFIVPQAVFNTSQFIVPASEAPPGSTDIPILISSLLI